MTREMRQTPMFAWLTILLYINSIVALPLFTASSRDRSVPGARTQGCAEATCCSALCYLDENGIHHCVPVPGRSCDCGLSSNGQASNSISPERDIVVPQPSGACPDFTVAYRTSEPPDALAELDLSVPNPPPKSSPVPHFV